MAIATNSIPESWLFDDEKMLLTVIAVLRAQARKREEANRKARRR